MRVGGATCAGPLALFPPLCPLLQYYLHAADHEYVLEELLPNALGQLAALTSLSLNGHDMPVCPWSLAHLPQLKHLDIQWNEGLRQLPHGPWPALEQLEVDNKLIDAALADQPAQPEGRPPAGEREGEGSAETGAGPGEGAGHALWSLSRLTHLRGLRGMAEEEEKKQTVRRLLPQLVRLE